MFIQHQVHSALIGTSFKELLVAAQHKYVYLYLSEVCGLFLLDLRGIFTFINPQFTFMCLQLI